MTPLPGERVTHPAAILALGLWLVNDHVAKGWLPGALTGKLSDVAGLAFFPVLLVAVWEVARARVGSPPSSQWASAAAIALTGAGFAAIEVCPLAERAWCLALGACQWPFRACASLAWHGQLAGFAPVDATADPTDLWTLPALGIAAWIERSARSPARSSRSTRGRERCRSGSAGGSAAGAEGAW